MGRDKSIKCENCGGTDFSKEGFFYYCTECQIQKEEIQESYCDLNDTEHIAEKKITFRKDPMVKQQAKLTLWETYNLILYGLVKELENLGADDKLKYVCYHLWLQYLTKLDNSNVSDKLGASHKKRGAEKVYKRKDTRKRKRSSASNTSTSDMDEKTKDKEKKKQKKQKERSKYESLSQSLALDLLSVKNQASSSLTSNKETSYVAGNIVFNKHTRNILYHHMSQYFKFHMQDCNYETSDEDSKKLIKSNDCHDPKILTRNKLYCLIYLAILLTQQEIQISDIIRYCREGHLSFLDYTHFFSDLVDTNLIDHTLYTTGSKQIPSYEFMRTFSFQLFQFLELTPVEFSPNILRLCRRYCTELNLPDQIYNIAGEYINCTRPFQSLLQPTCIPNYEGRAMGFIIYVLKVLFGFDDVTELELSKFAKLVNKKNDEDDSNVQPELFNFIDWFHYLEYRTVVLKYVHFPTWQLLHPDEKCPLDLYTKFIYDEQDICEKEPELVMSIAKKFLTKIKVDHGEQIKFESSFTPCRSKLEKLTTIENFEVLDKNLNLNIIKDASKHSINYLIEPHEYLEQIKAKKCSIIFSNAHSDHKFKEVDILRDPEHKYTDNTKAVTQKYERFCKKTAPETLSPEKIKTKEKKLRHVSLSPNTEFNLSFLHHIKTEHELKEEHVKENVNNIKKLNTNEKYKYHYIPRMEYCSNIKDVSNMTETKFKEFEGTLPKNFQWLLTQCARVIEQPTKDLYEEFVNVEVYMNYIHFKKSPCSNTEAINRLVKDVTKNW